MRCSSRILKSSRCSVSFDEVPSSSWPALSADLRLVPREVLARPCVLHRVKGPTSSSLTSISGVQLKSTGCSVRHRREVSGRPRRHYQALGMAWSSPACANPAADRAAVAGRPHSSSPAAIAWRSHMHPRQNGKDYLSQCRRGHVWALSTCDHDHRAWPWERARAPVRSSMRSRPRIERPLRRATRSPASVRLL